MLKLMIEGIVLLAGLWVIVTQIVSPLIVGAPLFPLLDRRFAKLDDRIEKSGETEALKKIAEKLKSNKE
jgi:hypothetical protein